MNQNTRILIVDDDRRMTRTLSDILTLAGYVTVEAWSGPEALEKARTGQFDCVLTDIRMPGMDGVELHRQLCQVQPGLPLVLMTAYAAEELIRRGLDQGVIGALEKPLDINQLLNFFASLTKTRTITIVDDDPAFCQTLGDILELRGYQVVKISDPHTPPDQIAGNAQIILLDMKLNHINGHDVLKELRALYPELPVLLVTGYRQEMAVPIQRALENDAYACLYKPLVIPDLLQKLAEIRAKPLRQMLVAK